MKVFLTVGLLMAIGIVAAPRVGESQEEVNSELPDDSESQIIVGEETEGNSADVEVAVLHAWKQYSKAFEYADYNQIGNHFTFPVTFVDPDGQASLLGDRGALIKQYQTIREGVQEGYRYSLLDAHQFHQYSNQVCMLDATYSRFNQYYERIHTGRGLYFFRFASDGWRLYTIVGLPVDSPRFRPTHLIQTETVYYTTGPQQSRPADGKLLLGTPVRVIRKQGSYTLVESEKGIIGYVIHSALSPMEIP
ncbi:MAG: hypothetical protein MK106_00715 [Mariniblastus sp.]|nr:hypothetical protein [Mariniblastus sp.]